MIDRICLTLAHRICPVSRTADPCILFKGFQNPEKRWVESSTGMFVEYMRLGERGVVWATDVDYEAFRNEFKMKQHPDMPLLYDNSVELHEVYTSRRRIHTLAKYATCEEMPDSVWLWMYQMSVAGDKVFDDFMKFYMNEKHNGVSTAKVFSALQMDKLRSILRNDEDLCRCVRTQVGTRLCVHVARYARSLEPYTAKKLLARRVSLSEIPRLPLDLADNDIDRFMRGVRVVLSA